MIDGSCTKVRFFWCLCDPTKTWGQSRNVLCVSWVFLPRTSCDIRTPSASWKAKSRPAGFESSGWKLTRNKKINWVLGWQLLDVGIFRVNLLDVKEKVFCTTSFVWFCEIFALPGLIAHVTYHDQGLTKSQVYDAYFRCSWKIETHRLEEGKQIGGQTSLTENSCWTAFFFPGNSNMRLPCSVRWIYDLISHIRNAKEPTSLENCPDWFEAGNYLWSVSTEEVNTFFFSPREELQ